MTLSLKSDFYVNKNDITDKELENFINDNKSYLKVQKLRLHL